GSVYYAQLNADGSTSGWTNGTNLTTGLSGGGVVVANGYIYYLGGGTFSSGPVTTIYFSQISSNGAVSAWTAANAVMPARSQNAVTAIYNGYIYSIGGQNGNFQNSASNAAYYNSTERVQVAGALDLVSIANGVSTGSGGSIGSGSVGGSLTAGDGTFVGDL